MAVHTVLPTQPFSYETYVDQNKKLFSYLKKRIFTFVTDEDDLQVAKSTDYTSEMGVISWSHPSLHLIHILH